MSVQIYALVDPRDERIRYIGKAKCAKERLKRHMRDRLRRDYPVYRWINKLLALGLSPIVRVLEEADDWKSAERRLIAESRARGDALLNVAEGGDEPHCSKEQRSANAKRLNERLKADPVLAKLRDAKRHFSYELKRGRVGNAMRAKLRLLAVKRPDLFGEWANLPDLVEHGQAH